MNATKELIIVITMQNVLILTIALNVFVTVDMKAMGFIAQKRMLMNVLMEVTSAMLMQHAKILWVDILVTVIMATLGMVTVVHQQL